MVGVESYHICSVAYMPVHIEHGQNNKSIYKIIKYRRKERLAHIKTYHWA